MMQTKPTHGGARLNAGAPKKIEAAKTRAIRLIDSDWLKLKSLGISWLKEELSKA